MQSVPDNLYARFETDLAAARVVAVVTIDRLRDVQPLIESLCGGGIRVIELALRTPVSIEALACARAAAPQMLLGAGTVLDSIQVDAAREAGADFALAPGFDAATVRRCMEQGFPFVPGVATASDIQAAIAMGCRVLKFFPAEPLGGASGLSTLAAPFLHLGVKFLPLGGITPDRTRDYLLEPSVVAVGGSWIAPSKLIHEGAWERIRENAARAYALALKTKKI